MGSTHKFVFLLFVAFVLKFAFCENDCKYKFETFRETENFNKKLVLSFVSQSIAGTDLDRIRQSAYKFIGDPYIQHNPMVADGREGFITGFGTVYLGTHIEFTKHVAADEDLVWLHSQYENANGSTKYVVADIFRVDCDKIVEHWDVVQPIDPNLKSPNSHPYF